MDIEDDPLLQDFFRKRGQKKTTQERYFYVLGLYKQATGHSPTSMIEEAEDEEDQNIRPRKRKIEQHLLSFTEYMQSKGFTADSIRANTSVVRSLYNHYGVQLPDRIKIQPEDTKLKLPTQTEIQLAISKSNPCYQAIIILMASSGMGRSEIINLTVNDFVKAVNVKNKDLGITLDSLPSVGETIPDYEDVQVRPLIWKVRRFKTGSEYFTFSSSESYQRIMMYLATNPAVITEDEPLFLDRTLKKINGRTFNQYFRCINARCGWGMVGKQIFFRSHNMRKWFASQLENTSLGYINTERLLGHSVLNDTARRYFKPDMETMYKLYYENMDRVTVFSKVDYHNDTDERLEEMKQTNEARFLKIERKLLEKDKELEEKNREIEKLKNK